MKMQEKISLFGQGRRNEWRRWRRMNELLLELQTFLWGIIPILLGYLGNKLRLFLDEKIETEKQEQIKDIVKGVVAFVEQVAKVDVELIGQEKLNLAKEKAVLLLNEKGFVVSEVELDMLIESFVLGLQEREWLIE